VNYAISRDTKIARTFQYDVVIIGAGLAGLYAALNIDERFRLLVLAKENMDCSSSWLAQGGIAAAINRDDTPQLHFDDTIVAGAGECNMDAVTVLVNEGPSDIETLAKLNVPFDLDEYGEFQFTREGGHNKKRVVHAGGDATGRETVRALSYIVARRKNITFSGHTCLFDVLANADGTFGVVVRYNNAEFHLISTNNVIIATGGIGQLYKSSTNPPVATGDGIAAAIRTGVSVTNLEFIQFHPTALWDEASNGSEFLISEAVRGEGGFLINSEGKRFMVGGHELAELAPRDVVARGIVKELKRSGEDHAYIDITSKPEDFLKRRFPTIYNECLNHGINIAHDKIPVMPVQHYLMGGIETDLYGRTSIRGLYACGEAANTGVHGANRLASNSMLECLVFGRRAARHVNANLEETESFFLFRTEDLPARPYSVLNYTRLREEIQQLMSDHCHVIRNKAGLVFALKRVSDILLNLESIYDDSNEYLEALNIATVAKAIAGAALSRPESIGSHYMEG